MKPGSPEWEQICRRCGRCCYEKIQYRGRIYYTDEPCEWLDTPTGLCTVYGQRQRLRPGCVALTEANVRAGILPADCPYVAGLQGYRAPVLTEDRAGLPPLSLNRALK